MKKKKTYIELKIENQMLKKTHASFFWASIINNIIKYGSICFISWMIYSSIACLSGKSTEANIVLNFLGNLKINTALAWIFGGGGLIYGIGERKLRKRTIKSLQSRIKRYEITIDKDRSSSRLTKFGDTHPRDKI